MLWDRFAIAGGFAVHLHQAMHGQRPTWKPTDVDVYYLGDRVLPATMDLQAHRLVLKLMEFI